MKIFDSTGNQIEFLPGIPSKRIPEKVMISLREKFVLKKEAIARENALRVRNKPRK